VHLKTDGTPSVKASVTALWGTKALDNVVDLDISFDVPAEKSVLRRLDQERYFLFSPSRLSAALNMAYLQCQRHSGQSPWSDFEICCGRGSHRK